MKINYFHSIDDSIHYFFINKREHYKIIGYSMSALRNTRILCLFLKRVPIQLSNNHHLTELGGLECGVDCGVAKGCMWLFESGRI